jgi:hypothetical protein
MTAFLVSVCTEGIIILFCGLAPSSAVLSASAGLSVIGLPWAVIGAGTVCGVLQITSKRRMLGSKYRDWLVQSWLPTFAVSWGSGLFASIAILLCLLIHAPASTLLIVTKLSASAGWLLCRLELDFLISRMRTR